MRNICVAIILSLMISGCATTLKPLEKLVSPSESLYSQAEQHFQNKKYDIAIAVYERFIKEYPNHKLVSGANLGIAWSYYLKKDCPKTLEYLAKVRTQDKDLKTWMEKLGDKCKKEIASSGTLASSKIFNIPNATNQEILKIEGAAIEGGKILINDEEVKAENGIFSKEITLKEGENPISIVITDKDGKEEIKDTVVVLDKTNPTIVVNSVELDDFGYIEILGETEKNARISIEDVTFAVDSEGKFSGKIKLPRNKQFKLIAKDEAGNTAEEVYADTESPDQPTGLRVRDIYGDTVDIEWDENREADIKGYNIYHSRQGEFSDLKKNTEIIEDTTYTLTGLGSGNTYTIYIRAIDKMGNESEVSEETLEVNIP